MRIKKYTNLSTILILFCYLIVFNCILSLIFIIKPLRK